MPRFQGTAVGEQTSAAPRFTGAPASNSPPPSWRDVAADTLKSAGTGLVNGATGLVGLPGTIDDLGHEGVDWALRKIDGAITGTEPPPLSERPGYSPSWLSGSAMKGYVESVAGPLHEPETTPGEYAKTIGEFAPGAVIGPGGIAGKVAGDWILPALASEAAGQLTDGTALETPARLAGALVGNAPSILARAQAGAAGRAVASTMDGLTDQQILAAQALQRKAESLGVPLTGPEAIQAVTGGATRLGDLQRVIEGSTAGGQTMAGFYARRPEQISGAARRAFEAIAPAPSSPSTLGQQASEAATGAIREVERARTAAVSPYFAAANLDAVPAVSVKAIVDDIDARMAADKTGVLAGPLGELRSRLIAEPGKSGSPAARTPITGPDGQTVRYSLTPAVEPTPPVLVTDLENLNRVRKFFRDKLDLPQIGQDATTKEQAAAISGYLDQLDQLMSSASPNYRTGNAEFARLSNEMVLPVSSGPLGDLAAARDTGSATGAVLPRRPLTGGSAELVDAIMRLEEKAPGLPAELIRQGLADQFDASAGRLVGGPNQFGGARFAKDIAGTAQQEADLAAVLEAVNRPGAKAGLLDLLDVLRATGARKPQGSATAFNQQMQDELGQLPSSATALAGAKTAGLVAAREIGDAARRVSLGRNTDRLARLFISPDSVDELRALAASSQASPIAETLIRAGIQVGSGR